MREVVIVKALRTAVGSFGGTLKDLTAADLGAVVIRRLLEETGLPPEELDEVILGNVLQAASGQNPARQAAIKAGIPDTVPSFTINKVCGSGLKAVGLAAQAIQVGDGDAYLAGGMESMSNAPTRFLDALGCQDGAQPACGHHDSRWLVVRLHRCTHGSHC